MDSSGSSIGDTNVQVRPTLLRALSKSSVDLYSHYRRFSIETKDCLPKTPARSHLTLAGDGLSAPLLNSSQLEQKRSSQSFLSPIFPRLSIPQNGYNTPLETSLYRLARHGKKRLKRPWKSKVSPDKCDESNLLRDAPSQEPEFGISKQRNGDNDSSQQSILPKIKGVGNHQQFMVRGVAEGEESLDDSMAVSPTLAAKNPGSEEDKYGVEPQSASRNPVQSRLWQRRLNSAIYGQLQEGGDDNKAISLVAKTDNVSSNDAILSGDFRVLKAFLNSDDAPSQSNGSSQHLNILQKHKRVDEMLNDLCNFTNDPKSVLNLSRSDGKTALHLASAYGTVLFVRKILSLGAMVDERCMAGRTPIHDAILSDNEDKEDIAAVLLEAGAGTNITDKDKMAAIHHATNIGNENIIKKLLQKGANVMTVNSIGQTPLHLAVNHGPPVLESLFSGGPGRDIPDVNARSSDGVTPLHLAAVVGNIEIMELLLKKGADPTIAAGKWKESALEMLYHNCLIKLKQDEMACNIRIAQQLSDDALIVATPRPINTSLHFATVFRSIAVASPDLSDGYERLSNQMDCLAVKLMQHCLNRNHALSLVEEDGNYLLNYALKYKHKKVKLTIVC
ncbi:uncharacterized protein LOC100374891 [Saccoglossus kowalevskii]